MNSARAIDDVFRRFIDICGAALLMVLTAPISVVVAVLIRVTSPGPVLFAQERLGRNGVPFRMYKFRSMCVDAEVLLSRDAALRAKYLASGHKLSDAEDWRITPLGRTLRRVRFDEVPQLYNVLRGDMSLIGPRPIVTAEAQHYPGYIEITRAVRPGITGLWQVSGEPSVSYARREASDREYSRTYSLRGDAVILWRTLRLLVKALRRDGSSVSGVEGE